MIHQAAPLAGVVERTKLTVTLGMGEFHVTRDRDAILACLGLGSCVALALYDPVTRTGGMAHLVLPTAGERKVAEPGARFVDTGVPLLIDEMQRLGAIRLHTVALLVGGAQVVGAGMANRVLNIGDRNIEAAREMIERCHLRLRASDLGGNRGRTVRLHIDTGRLVVRTTGGPTVQL